MADPHSIRLRGPWELRPLVRFLPGGDGRRFESAADLPAGGRLQMPADWSALLGRDYCGRVRHLRRFNRPTGLSAQTRVLLVCEGAIDVAAAMLNGQPLGRIVGPAARAVFDITACLAGHNELAVDVEFDGGATDTSDRGGGLVGEVRLEILEAILGIA